MREKDRREAVEGAGCVMSIYAFPKSSMPLTKDRHKILNVVGQVDSHLASAGHFPVLAKDVDVLAQLRQVMLFNLFAAKGTHDRALRHLLPVRTSLAALQDFPPDVPQVSIFPALPPRLIQLLDVQAGLERIAMRNLGTAVDGRLILISYWRC